MYVYGLGGRTVFRGGPIGSRSLQANRGEKWSVSRDRSKAAIRGGLTRVKSARNATVAISDSENSRPPAWKNSISSFETCALSSVFNNVVNESLREGNPELENLEKRVGRIGNCCPPFELNWIGIEAHPVPRHGVPGQALHAFWVISLDHPLSRFCPRATPTSGLLTGPEHDLLDEVQSFPSPDTASQRGVRVFGKASLKDFNPFQPAPNLFDLPINSHL